MDLDRENTDRCAMFPSIGSTSRTVEDATRQLYDELIKFNPMKFYWILRPASGIKQEQPMRRAAGQPYRMVGQTGCNNVSLVVPISTWLDRAPSPFLSF
jgi:hypothetical protein